MEEEFNIKILVKQNQALVALVTNKKLKLSESLEQLQLITRRDKLLCSRLQQLLSQLQNTHLHLSTYVLQIINCLQHRPKQQQYLQSHRTSQSQIHAVQHKKPTQIAQSPVVDKADIASHALKEQIAKMLKQSEQSEVQPDSCFLHPLYQYQRTKIEVLQNQNELLKRRITLLGNYSTLAVDKIIQEEQHFCYCGGLLINYYNKKLEQLIELKKIQIKQSQQKLTTPNMQVEMQASPQVESNASVLSEQVTILTNRLCAAQKKLLECRSNHKTNLQLVLNSQSYQVLKNQAKQMMFFISHLTNKLQNVGEYLKIIEQQRNKQLESVMAMNKGSKEEFKVESLVKSNSPVFNLLEQIRDRCESVLEESKSGGRKIKEKLRQRREQCDMIGKLRKQIHEDQDHKLRRLQQHRFVPKKFNFLCHHILKLLESEQVQKYYAGTDIKVGLMLCDWRKFLQYFKSQQSLLDSTRKEKEHYMQELSEKEKQRTFLIEIFNEIEEMLTRSTDGVKRIRESLSEMELKVSQLEFAFGDYKAKEYFRMVEEQSSRKIIQEKMEKLVEKEQQLIQVMEDRTHVYELVELQTVKFKKQQAEYLLTIEELRRKLSLFQRANEERQASVDKLLQDRVKCQLQMDRLKQRVSNGQESESSLQMKKLIEKYVEKISCICGRGNEASAVLNCRHIFCKSCIEKVVRSRKRSCPICNAKFSQSEVHYFLYNN